MPFPPQQADEHCKGTGQGELNELNQDYSDQLQPFWVQCEGVQARAPRNWELPRLLFERSRKGESYRKNTRSFGHCQNYYINRKDLSLSLWSNDHNGELFRKTPGSQRLAGSPILWYGPGNLSWILFYHYDHYHYGPRNHSIIHLTSIYFITIVMRLPKFFLITSNHEIITRHSFSILF